MAEILDPNKKIDNNSGGDGGGGQAQPMTPQQQGSGLQTGGFSNLRKFIDANKGEGQRMSQTIGQKAEQTRQKAETAQADTTNAFETQRKAEQDRLDAAQGFQTRLGEAGGAQAIAGDQGQLKQFQQAMSGQYQKPEYDLSQAQALGSQYGQLAGLSASEPGRFELLRKTFQKPQYNTGMQKLDQLLLQTDPNGAARLQQQLQQGTTQLGQGLQNLQGQFGTQQEQLAQLAKTRQDELTGALGEQVTGFGTDLQAREDARQAEINAELARGQTGQFNEDELRKLGLISTAQMAGRDVTVNRDLMGLTADDINKYRSAINSNVDVTKENVATQEDELRARALETLQGNTGNPLLGTRQDIGDLFSYDKTGLMDTLTNRTNQYNTSRDALVSQQAAANSQLERMIESQMVGLANTDMTHEGYYISDAQIAGMKRTNPEAYQQLRSQAQERLKNAEPNRQLAQYQSQLAELKRLNQGNVLDLLGNK